MDELAETLEGSLQDAHRPIGTSDGVSTMTVETSQSVMATLNETSKDWVNTREEAVHLEDFVGNITRYNSLSRNARAYIRELQRVVPIRPDGDFNTGDLQLLTWSLHGTNVGTPSALSMRARSVKSASGKVKRLLLSDCQRAS